VWCLVCVEEAASSLQLQLVHVDWIYFTKFVLNYHAYCPTGHCVQVHSAVRSAEYMSVGVLQSRVECTGGAHLYRLARYQLDSDVMHVCWMFFRLLVAAYQCLLVWFEQIWCLYQGIISR
jgi:hypothetical protein